MIVLQEALEAELGNKAFVDGHDAGLGQMNIFIHTNDPKRISDTILLSQDETQGTLVQIQLDTEKGKE
jgi:hypothetical protein